MRGGIYENKSGKGAPWIVKFPGVFRRFKELEKAERFLNGLRWEWDQGGFDPRDYGKAKPHIVSSLATQWIKMKENQGLRCLRARRLRIGKVVSFFGHRNLKTIGDADIEDFRAWLLRQFSTKYTFDIEADFKEFLRWAEKRVRYGNKRTFEIPAFPPLKVEMAIRDTISFKDQDKILEASRKRLDRRVWFAFRLLSFYPKIRPGELLNVLEGDIDLNLGIIRIQHPKDRKTFKEVKLLDGDIEIFRSFPRAMPHLHFFRHEKGRWAGQRYGENLLRNHWRKACKAAGVSYVSLYPGTKHSTIRGLRQYLTPDQIKQGAGIKSSSSFMRYFAEEYEDQILLSEQRERLRG